MVSLGEDSRRAGVSILWWQWICSVYCTINIIELNESDLLLNTCLLFWFWCYFSMDNIPSLVPECRWLAEWLCGSLPACPRWDEGPRFNNQAGQFINFFFFFFCAQHLHCSAASRWGVSSFQLFSTTWMKRLIGCTFYQCVIHYATLWSNKRFHMW